MVLFECSSVVDSVSGEAVPLTTELREQAARNIEAMATSGLRTIALAYADLSGSTLSEEISLVSPPSGVSLTLIGICGIEDPVRDEVPAAVQQCQQAGIKVRMLTGDNIQTAKKIAQDCNILTPGGLALEGPVFRAMSDSEVDAILDKLEVMARSSPQDKFRLVQRLRARGEVVAVTGNANV
jgi:Ca2+-transporting ATPase